MKKILTAAAIGALAFAIATPALALDPNNPKPTEPTQTMGEQPDTSMDETGAINRVTLVPGENSFTENQAKARIESAGFTAVSGLKLDEQGIWRGTATKGATSVKVGIDFQGNIAADSTAAQ